MRSVSITRVFGTNGAGTRLNSRAPAQTPRLKKASATSAT